MSKPIVKLGSGYGASFSPDGRFLVTTPSTSPAKVFRTDDWMRSAELESIKYPRFVWWDRNSATVLVASIDKAVGVFDAESGRQLVKWKSPHQEFTPMTVTPDAKHLVVWKPEDSEQVLLCYSLKTGKCVDRIQLDVPIGRGLRLAAFTTSGKFLGVVWNEQIMPKVLPRLTVYRWPSMKHVWMTPLKHPVFDRMEGVPGVDSFCLDRFMAAGITEVSIADAKSKSRRLILADEAKDFGFKFSQCGTRLIYWYCGFVHLCDVSGKSEHARLTLPGKPRVFEADLSPCGNLLAVATSAVSVWNVRDLE